MKTVEQVVSWSTSEGPEGLVALRLAAAKAAMVGRLDLMPYFIEEKNVPVHTITAEEEALLDAHYSDYSDLEKWLLRYMPLFVAIDFGEKQVVNYLLKWVKKEEVETRDCLGRACLIPAVQIANLHAVQHLLALGADMQASSGQGHRLLFYAIGNGNVAVMDVLLAHAKVRGGEDLYQALLKQPCECRKMPLLFCAIDDGQLPLVEYLKEKEGPHILYQVSIIADVKEEILPHHRAAYNGKLSILEWFLAQGVPVDFVATKSKMTALHFTCLNEMDEADEATLLSVARYLVAEHHADIHLPTAEGHTAADVARSFGNQLIEAYLKEREEEDLQKAIASSEAARAALLAELDAEEAAAAAAAAAVGNSTKKKKKQTKSNNKIKGGKKGGESKEENEEKKEPREGDGDEGAAWRRACKN